MIKKLTRKQQEKFNDIKTVKDFNQWWWQDLNVKCKTCLNTCKQSWRSEIYRCPYINKEI